MLYAIAMGQKISKIDTRSDFVSLINVLNHHVAMGFAPDPTEGAY